MFEATLRLIGALADRQPIELLPQRLDVLFAALADCPGDRAHQAEDEIWAIWMSYPEREAREQMEQAIHTIARRRLKEAQPLLDDLVRGWPLWPEAWNKRATLAFLRGDDKASVRDIGRTLELAPRHFGALAGLAQICLRQGQTGAALVVLDAALAIHPHLVQAKLLRDRLLPLHSSGRH